MYNEERFQIEKDLLRESLAKYTRKAFRMLPKMYKPRILDVGVNRQGKWDTIGTKVNGYLEACCIRDKDSTRIPRTNPCLRL